MTQDLQTTRRSQWMRAAIATITVAGIVAIAVVARQKGKSETKANAATDGAMPGMEGMPGMNMPAGGAVTLSTDQIRQFGVTFGAAEMRTLTNDTRATGVVTVDETTLSKVVPRFSGFVERLHANFVAQPVRRGDPLIEIYSPEAVAAQQELLVAVQLQRDMGRLPLPGTPPATTNLVDAARRRLRVWDISDTQIDEVIRSGQPRRTLTLYAPSSGVIVDKQVIDGQAVQPGDHLYTIADLATVWIDVQLRETDAASFRTGNEARIELAGLPGRPATGRVAFIHPMLDSATRAVRARITVPNPNGVLKPGMFATVRITGTSRRALTVPNEAVLRTGDRNIVFVDMGGGQLMPHDVELGSVADNYVEVLAGLEPGQRVVTSAQFLLDSESNLAEVMRAMIGQTGRSDMGKARR